MGGGWVGGGTGVLLRAHGAVGEEIDPSNLDAAEGFRTLPSASYTSTCTSSVRCGGGGGIRGEEGEVGGSS